VRQLGGPQQRLHLLCIMWDDLGLGGRTPTWPAAAPDINATLPGDARQEEARLGQPAAAARVAGSHSEATRRTLQEPQHALLPMSTQPQTKPCAHTHSLALSLLHYCIHHGRRAPGRDWWDAEAQVGNIRPPPAAAWHGAATHRSDLRLEVINNITHSNSSQAQHYRAAGLPPPADPPT
jgi:hypothetical protein